MIQPKEKHTRMKWFSLKCYLALEWTQTGCHSAPFWSSWKTRAAGVKHWQNLYFKWGRNTAREQKHWEQRDDNVSTDKNNIYERWKRNQAPSHLIGLCAQSLLQSWLSYSCQRSIGATVIYLDSLSFIFLRRNDPRSHK